MFWCNECNRYLKQDEVIFDNEIDTFRCRKCGNLVEYAFNKRELV